MAEWERELLAGDDANTPAAEQPAETAPAEEKPAEPAAASEETDEKAE